MDTQKSYSITEKNLLAIVFCLKNILNYYMMANFVCLLIIRTLSIQHVLRWRFFMDNFDLKLHYVEGKNNVLVDCCSRFPQIIKHSNNN